MNSNPPSKTGIPAHKKWAYAEKYFTRKAIRNQRCVGISESALDEIKDVVQLIAMNKTTIRSYVSAVVANHLKEYKFLHEYLRRVMYDRLQPDDIDKYNVPCTKYQEKYLKPNKCPHNTAWIHLDADCAEALKHLVSWTGTGATISSFAEAIILSHLDEHKLLLDEMKSDVYNCQL